MSAPRTLERTMKLQWLTIAIIFISFDFSNGRSANIKPPYSYCQSEVANLLKSWRSLGQWRMVPKNRGFKYQTPTSKIGTWITLSQETAFLTLRLHSNKVTKLAIFAQSQCQPKYVTQKVPPIKIESNTFSDQDFTRLLNESRRTNSQGIIYVWSPYMNWSPRGVSEVQKIARSKNLKLTVLMDPSGDLKTALKIIRDKKLPPDSLRKVASQELFFRGLRNHYPSFLYYSKGKIIGNLKTGYDQPEVLKKVLNAYSTL